MSHVSFESQEGLVKEISKAGLIAAPFADGEIDTQRREGASECQFLWDRIPWRKRGLRS